MIYVVISYLAVLAVIFSVILFAVSGPSKKKNDPSSLLDGYWESGGEFFLEISNGCLLVRDSSLQPVMSTPFNCVYADGDPTKVVLLPAYRYVRNVSQPGPFAEFTSLIYDSEKIDLEYRLLYDGVIRRLVFRKAPPEPYSDPVPVEEAKNEPEAPDGMWIEETDSSQFHTMYFRSGRLTVLFAEQVIYSGQIKVNADGERTLIIDASGTTQNFGPFDTLEYRADEIIATVSGGDGAGKVIFKQSI